MAETLKLQPNRTEIIALQFATGREVEGLSGTQMMYTLTDNRRLYLNLEDARKIEDLSLGKGEPFEITRREKLDGRKRLITYEVQYSSAAPATPAPQASTRQVVQTMPSANITQEASHHPQATNSAPQSAPRAPEAPTPAPIPATRIMSALCAAIDAVVEAQAYATRKGLHIAFTSEDVRAIANTLHIDASKGGR
jgi:hypothetical protein